MIKKITSKVTAPAKELTGITKQASLAGRALARLEATAAAVHESETACRERELQLVSTQAGGFSALIKHGKTVVEIQGDSFAVRQMD
jgi:hypothetical protein